MEVAIEHIRRRAPFEAAQVVSRLMGKKLGRAFRSVGDVAA
jgi:hypothetical protein